MTSTVAGSLPRRVVTTGRADDATSETRALVNRYTMTAGDMLLSADLVRKLDVVLEPGRRSLSDYIARNAELRQWFAEFDANVPPRPAQPSTRPETVWVSTEQAADMLGVSPRRVRQIKSTLRHEYHGRLLVFDRADVEDEVAARLAA